MVSFVNMKKELFTFQTPLVWRNVIGLFVMHVLAIYALFYVVPKVRIITFIFGYLYGYVGCYSVTIGAHRLWTHKTFKAKLPLRVLFMLGHLAAGQYSIVQWARDHRLHHKFSDTEADPHNARRGFLYSHCGWLMMKRTAELKEKGKFIDVSDLWQDPVVVFQQKYFVPLLITIHFIVPVAVGHYILGETWSHCILGLFIFRYVCSLHLIWMVNSVTHLYGSKPYNNMIMAVQNKAVAFLGGGEGWHNFHHVFPWDYRIGEYGQGYQYGAVVIEIFAKLGLAYDLKTASPEMIKKVLSKSTKMNEKFELSESKMFDYENNNEIVEKKSLYQKEYIHLVT